MHIRKCACVRAYTHTHVRAQTDTHTHTHTHSHTTQLAMKEKMRSAANRVSFKSAVIYSVIIKIFLSANAPWNSSWSCVWLVCARAACASICRRVYKKKSAVPNFFFGIHQFSFIESIFGTDYVNILRNSWLCNISVELMTFASVTWHGVDKCPRMMQQP